MRRIPFLLLTSVLLSFSAPISSRASENPNTDSAQYSIPVTGAVARPVSIDPTLMTTLPRQSIEASDHGEPARFEGVWLRDALVHAGAPLGKGARWIRQIERIEIVDLGSLDK